VQGLQGPDLQSETSLSSPQLHLGISMNPKVDEAVLKEQMARALGFRSWDHFLKQNYTSPLPFSRSQKNGARMYAWKCPRTKVF
jgi:hypothetical protein